MSVRGFEFAGLLLAGGVKGAGLKLKSLTASDSEGM